MANKVPKATRLPKDYADALEQYCEERDILEAHALQRFIIDGLDDADSELVERSADMMPVPQLIQIILLTVLIALNLI
jgi:hypothetical protein